MLNFEHYLQVAASASSGVRPGGIWDPSGTIKAGIPVGSTGSQWDSGIEGSFLIAPRGLGKGDGIPFSGDPSASRHPNVFVSSPSWFPSRQRSLFQFGNPSHQSQALSGIRVRDPRVPLGSHWDPTGTHTTECKSLPSCSASSSIIRPTRNFLKTASLASCPFTLSDLL